MKQIELPDFLESYKVTDSIFESEHEFPAAVWGLLKKFQGKRFHLSKMSSHLKVSWDEAKPFLLKLRDLGCFEKVEEDCSVFKGFSSSESSITLGDFDQLEDSVESGPEVEENSFQINVEKDALTVESVCVEID